MECCILGQENDAQGTGAHFFPGKRNMTWIYAPTSFFKKLYQSFFFSFFCSHTLDNLIFKLAKIEMRCVQICERLWDTNTLQTFSVLNIRSPAAAVARSHSSFFRQVLLWSYQGKVLIPKAFCAGFHYESPIFRKRSLWKENTPPPLPSPFIFIFSFAIVLSQAMIHHCGRERELGTTNHSIWKCRTPHPKRHSWKLWGAKQSPWNNNTRIIK